MILAINRSIRELVFLACVLVSLAATLFGCGGSNPTLPSNKVDAGRELTVNSTVFAATSKPAYDAMIEALEVNDTPKVKGMVATGDVFIIEPGEHATILDQGRFWYKVQFTSGQHSRRIGWFGMEFAN